MLGCIRSNFSTPLLNISFAAVVHFLPSAFFCISFTSATLSPPNSSLMAFICCCKKYSRCCLSNSLRVLLVTLFLSSAYCNSVCIKFINNSALAFILLISSSFCFSLISLFKLLLTKCIKKEGFSIFFNMIEASLGKFGDRPIICAAKSLILLTIAEKSASSFKFSSTKTVIFALK